jgi:hypothetical protein
VEEQQREHDTKVEQLQGALQHQEGLLEVQQQETSRIAAERDSLQEKVEAALASVRIPQGLYARGCSLAALIRKDIRLPDVACRS